TEEITKKIEALQRDAAGSVDAVHRISQAIEAIRPVFETVNRAVAEQNHTTSEMSENAASASSFIASVGDSAVEIDSATKEAETHGESVAKAGQAVTMFAQKLKSRCAVLLRRDEGAERRKDERLPCSLKIEIQTPRGVISMEDMFDTNYVEISGSNPVQHRTRILDWADRALPPFQETFLARDSRMAFAAMIDRNGYLPVHNKIYSHPQRPGDVAYNTA